MVRGVCARKPECRFDVPVLRPLADQFGNFLRECRTDCKCNPRSLSQPTTETGYICIVLKWTCVNRRQTLRECGAQRINRQFRDAAVSTRALARIGIGPDLEMDN